MEGKKIIFRLKKDRTLADLPAEVQSLGDSITRLYFIDNDIKKFRKFSNDKEVDVLSDENLFVSKILPNLSEKEQAFHRTYIIDPLENEKTKRISVALETDDAVEYTHPNFNYGTNTLPGPVVTLPTISEAINKLECCRVWHGHYENKKITGVGVNVAVIDSGIDFNHHLISDNVWNGNNNHGFDLASSGNTLDQDGHGSHCAGTIAGKNNAKFTIGVAPQASVVTFKVPFPITDTQYCANAIKLAKDQNFRILSNSWEPTEPNSDDKTLRAEVISAFEAGCIMVFAAGNKNKNVSAYFPANSPEYVISVGATFNSDYRWVETDQIHGSNFGDGITIAAPGFMIDSISANTKFATAKTGTSMACAHVSGVIALLLQIDPYLSFSKVKEIIVSTGDDMNNDPQFPLGVGKRINAANSVDKLLAEKNATRLPLDCKPESILVKVLNSVSAFLDNIAEFFSK